jgi:hypothetical protein
VRRQPCRDVDPFMLPRQDAPAATRAHDHPTPFGLAGLNRLSVGSDTLRSIATFRRSAAVEVEEAEVPGIQAKARTSAATSAKGDQGGCDR